VRVCPCSRAPRRSSPYTVHAASVRAARARCVFTLVAVVGPSFNIGEAAVSPHDTRVDRCGAVRRGVRGRWRRAWRWWCYRSEAMEARIDGGRRRTLRHQLKKWHSCFVCICGTFEVNLRRKRHRSATNSTITGSRKSALKVGGIRVKSHPNRPQKSQPTGASEGHVGSAAFHAQAARIHGRSRHMCPLRKSARCGPRPVDGRLRGLYCVRLVGWRQGEEASQQRIGIALRNIYSPDAQTPRLVLPPFCRCSAGCNRMLCRDSAGGPLLPSWHQGFA